MNCWHCGTELIWGGDHDLEDTTDEYDMVTNLSCPNCGAYVEVYRPNYEHEDMKGYRQKTDDNVIDTHTEFFTYPEEPSPTPDASWIDEVKTQDGE